MRRPVYDKTGKQLFNRMESSLLFIKHLCNLWPFQFVSVSKLEHFVIKLKNDFRAHEKGQFFSNFDFSYHIKGYKCKDNSHVLPLELIWKIFNPVLSRKAVLACILYSALWISYLWGEDTITASGACLPTQNVLLCCCLKMLH